MEGKSSWRMALCEKDMFTKTAWTFYHSGLNSLKTLSILLTLCPVSSFSSDKCTTLPLAPYPPQGKRRERLPPLGALCSRRLSGNCINELFILPVWKLSLSRPRSLSVLMEASEPLSTLRKVFMTSATLMSAEAEAFSVAASGSGGALHRAGALPTGRSHDRVRVLTRRSTAVAPTCRLLLLTWFCCEAVACRGACHRSSGSGQGQHWVRMDVVAVQFADHKPVYVLLILQHKISWAAAFSSCCISGSGHNQTSPA